METCFVMQPFDGDVYDKRYNTVFSPAITEAGLQPYRVDRDMGVSVPINEIETGIRKARICFAEITTDNPNVWFELGYAIAASKEVVLVCSEDRESHFPFDVQHRTILKYRCGAPQDFDELQNKITQCIIALLKKDEEISKASIFTPVKDTEGLSAHEMVTLVVVMQNTFLSPGSNVNAYTVKNNMNIAGFTDIATALALRRLEQKDFLRSCEREDVDGIPYKGFVITQKGMDWLAANQERLELKKDLIPF